MEPRAVRSYSPSVLVALLLLLSCEDAPDTGAVQVVESDRYEDLLALHSEWRAIQRPTFIDGVPDYTPVAMAEQAEELSRYEARLAAIDPEGWPVSQQVDHHIVRAEMKGLEFDHRVLRPWARNPAFYMLIHGSQSDVPARAGEVMHGVIELWRYQFPLSEADAAEIHEGIRRMPAVLEQARENLVVDAADLCLSACEP